MTTYQPEALRLADHLEKFRSFPDDLAAAAELRRLHTENQALRNRKAYVITRTKKALSFAANAEIVCVFDTEKSAKAFCKQKNSERSTRHVYKMKYSIQRIAD